MYALYLSACHSLARSMRPWLVTREGSSEAHAASPVREEHAGGGGGWQRAVTVLHAQLAWPPGPCLLIVAIRKFTITPMQFLPTE